MEKIKIICIKWEREGEGEKNSRERERESRKSFFAHRVLIERRIADKSRYHLKVSIVLQLDVKFVIGTKTFFFFVEDALLIIVSPDTCQVTLKLDDIL